ncbi:MAG: hypothetical protein JWL98_2242 [Xanthomonadaceae bacterium]|nr:hypothetical protein [Xanthomonadaceae bacterium]
MRREKRLCMFAIAFHLAAVVLWCYLKQHTGQAAVGLLIGWSVWSGAKASSSLMKLSGNDMAR